MTTPGERSRISREARRADLLAAAHEMFSMSGYHATSMEVIAERAGVSKPVLYRHFPGKLDLYRALVQDAAGEMVRIVRAAVHSCGEAESRVHAAVRSYFDVVSSHRGLAGLLFDVEVRSTPSIAAVIEWADAACIDAIADVVAEEAGLSREHARLLAAGLVGLSTATARYWWQSPRTDRDDAIALTAELAWGGIGGFPRVGPDRAHRAGPDPVGQVSP